MTERIHDNQLKGVILIVLFTVLTLISLFSEA